MARHNNQYNFTRVIFLFHNFTKVTIIIFILRILYNVFTELENERKRRQNSVRLK